MNPRTQRANQMMATTGYASQIETNKFKVRSQTDPSKFYIILNTGDGLICGCKDYEVRKADCKHIKIVLDIIKKNQCYRNNTFKIMERSKLSLCRFCDSGRLIKRGIRKNKGGNIQRYQCLDCKKRFTANFGFEKMRSKDVIITRALQMYYAGMSVRDIADCFEQEEIEVSYRSI